MIVCTALGVIVLPNWKSITRRLKETGLKSYFVDCDDVYIKQVELDKLFKSNSYDDVVTALVKQIKNKTIFTIDPLLVSLEDAGLVIYVRVSGEK